MKDYGILYRDKNLMISNADNFSNNISKITESLNINIIDGISDNIAQLLKHFQCFY